MAETVGADRLPARGTPEDGGAGAREGAVGNRDVASLRAARAVGGERGHDAAGDGRREAGRAVAPIATAVRPAACAGRPVGSARSAVSRGAPCAALRRTPRGWSRTAVIAGKVTYNHSWSG